MAVSLDLTKTPSDAFYELLTKSTTALPENTVLTDQDLSLSAVTAVSGREDGNNTSILLTPISTSTVVYGEAKTVYYKRRDIASYPIDLAITDELDNWTADTAAASALAYLKANFSSAMVAADITVSAPTTNEDGTVSVTVGPVTDHLTLFGQVILTVTQTENRLNTESIPDSQDGFASGS